MNSRTKGKVGELEFAKFLKDRGFEARRGQQFKGGADSPDVVAESLPFHFEVKRVERLNLEVACAQATRDAKRGKMPIVAHRRNRGEWMATVRMEDLLNLYIGSAA